jgi:hypothetical protein
VVVQLAEAPLGMRQAAACGAVTTLARIRPEPPSGFVSSV